MGEFAIFAPEKSPDQECPSKSISAMKLGITSNLLGYSKPIKIHCNKYTEISAFSHMLQTR